MFKGLKEAILKALKKIWWQCSRQIENIDKEIEIIKNKPDGNYGVVKDNN